MSTPLARCQLLWAAVDRGAALSTPLGRRQSRRGDVDSPGPLSIAARKCQLPWRDVNCIRPLSIAVRRGQLPWSNVSFRGVPSIDPRPLSASVKDRNSFALLSIALDRGPTEAKLAGLPVSAFTQQETRSRSGDSIFAEPQGPFEAKPGLASQVISDPTEDPTDRRVARRVARVEPISWGDEPDVAVGHALPWSNVSLRGAKHGTRCRLALAMGVQAGERGTPAEAKAMLGPTRGEP